MKIAITGHRPDAFIVSHYDSSQVIRIANDMVCTFKREFGDDLTFNLGGAIGVDQWVGMACIEHRVRFKMFLPFLPEVQGRYWSREQKDELDRQLMVAAGIDITDLSGQYIPQMYQIRNKKMIDAADFLVAFWVGKRRGGTYNAIKYALKQSKFVYNAMNERKLIVEADLKKGWTPPTMKGDSHGS